MIQGRLSGIIPLSRPPRPVRVSVPPIGLALLAIALGACATPTYAVRTYADRKPVEVKVGTDRYQVLDRPDLGRLLVAGSPDGTSEPSATRVTAVAMRFLAESGRRSCKLGEGSGAARPFFEVTYACEKPKPRHVAPASLNGSTRSSPGPVPAQPLPLRMNRL